MNIVASIICCLISFTVGHWAGAVGENIARQPLEVKNGCAYYDMDTGKFTWGQKPLTMSMPSGDRSGDVQIYPAPRGKSK